MVYSCNEEQLMYLALVINCQTMAAEGGTQFLHDVGLVLPVVPDKYGSQMWSTGYVMRGKRRKVITTGHITFPMPRIAAA